MANDLDERGYFWWGDEPIPDGYIAPAGTYGRLTVSETGEIRLELDGTLSPRGPLGAIENRGRPLRREIAGKLRDTQRSILLGGVWGDGGKMTSGGLSYEVFAAEKCLVSSQHLPHSTESAKVRKLMIPLSGFEEWVRLGSIITRRNRRSKSTSIKYRTPPKREYAFSNGRFEILFDLVGPHYGRSNRDKVDLKEEVYIVFRLRRPTTIQGACELYRAIEDLMIILTNVERSLAWPVVYSKEGSPELTIYFGRGKRSNIEVSWHKCWTALPGIYDVFGSIVNNWLNRLDSLGPGIYLYVGNRRGMDLFAENKFNNLMFGLEAFHRGLNPLVEDLALRQKVERILSNIQVDTDRKWLERRLRNLGEPSLQQRIFETLSKLPIGIPGRSLHTFAERCARIRNDLSHYGEIRSEASHIEKLQELGDLSYALSYLYHARILQEIGVPDGVICDIFKGGFDSFRVRHSLWKVGLADEEPGFS